MMVEDLKIGGQEVEGEVGGGRGGGCGGRRLSVICCCYFLLPTGNLSLYELQFNAAISHFSHLYMQVAIED